MNLFLLIQAIIKKAVNEFIILFSEVEQPDKKEIVGIFNDMLEEVQCEKFIAVGHMIENMFIYDNRKSNYIMNLLISLFLYKTIDEEDLKHGYFNIQTLKYLI